MAVTLNEIATGGVEGAGIGVAGAGLLVPGPTGPTGSALLVTDGSNVVTDVANLTITGGTVSGTTPNATITVSGGGDPLALVHGLTINATDPNVTGNPNDAQAVSINVTYDKLVTNIGFTDQNAVEITENFYYGQNQYSGGTNAKSTPVTLDLTQNAIGSGEHILLGMQMYGLGFSDTFLMSGALTYASGPIAGDEGVGFSPSMYVQQLGYLALANIVSVTRTTLTTTITQNVVASQNAQTISVASTSGANAGDWVVFNQGLPSGYPNICAAQIISVGSGTITCICPNNFNSGTTVTPALVLSLDGNSGFGQDRVLVNLSGASYSTGTAGKSVGGNNTPEGSGTTWTVGMVGGDAANIGAFSYDADTYTGVPFNSGYSIPLGTSSSLRSWYQINQLSSTTALSILSFDVAGAGQYQGNAPAYPSTGNYIIRPAARILYLDGNLAVCETSTATWSVNDQVECTICPYPDVHGWDFKVGKYTPGGTPRQMLGLSNIGARQLDSGMFIKAVGGTIGQAGSSKYGFTTGIAISDSVTGIYFAAPSAGAFNASAMTIAYDSVAGTNDAGACIQWIGGQIIRPNTASYGLDIFGAITGAGYGTLRFIGNAGTDLPQLLFTGMVAPNKVTFSQLPAASSALEGYMVNVTDANTGTWGATITAGSSTFHVLARCNGIDWTVVGA